MGFKIDPRLTKLNLNPTHRNRSSLQRPAALCHRYPGPKSDQLVPSPGRRQGPLRQFQAASLQITPPLGVYILTMLSLMPCHRYFAQRRIHRDEALPAQRTEIIPKSRVALDKQLKFCETVENKGTWSLFSTRPTWNIFSVVFAGPCSRSAAPWISARRAAGARVAQRNHRTRPVSLMTGSGQLRQIANTDTGQWLPRQSQHSQRLVFGVRA